MMTRVVVAGVTGWVGRALVPAIMGSDDLRLVGAVARGAAGRDVGTATGTEPMGLTVVSTVTEAVAIPFDVLVDYTASTVVKANTLAALAAGRHVVIGTSGLGEDDFAEIDAAARRGGVGVIAAGNFSVTAALMKRFALMAARYVPDVEVLDTASADKLDAPSGTARELAEALAAVRRPSTARPLADVAGVPDTRGAAIGAGEGVRVHALRLPSYTLACEALFALPDERLSIRHEAGTSAAPYVAGTLLAVRRVAAVTGLVRGLDALMD